MEEVGVVICNYNKEDDVIICIQAALDNKFSDIHIYVVDNASTDNSVNKIIESYGANERVTLLQNQENLGGSGGFNRGLREALAKGHPYLMCVDNDAFLDENCIGSLYDFLQENQEVGIAAAKIVHRGMEGYIQQYGSFIDFKDYCVDSIYLNHTVEEALPEVVYSDAVPACALMIRKSLVEQIGVMPEENFLYWDDTEWCIRCREAGYKVASLGKALASHAMGAKGELENTFPTYYAWRNEIVFFLNHIPEDQLEDMAELFLGAIFDVAYDGLYRGDDKKTTTVMAALDDALHGVMGKAGPDRIFKLENNFAGIQNMLRGKKHIFIDVNGFPLYADRLRQISTMLGENLLISLSTEMTAMESEEKNSCPVDCYVSICENIFTQEDLSLKQYYVDLEDKVLGTEDDVLMVINYNYSKRSFVFANKPGFVRLARHNYFE